MMDIVLCADALDAARQLIAALRQAPVRSAVDAPGGYDLSRSGTGLKLFGKAVRSGAD